MVYKEKLDPETSSFISMKAFKNVKNIKEIREKLLNGSLGCCVCKSSLILHPLQIIVAANKAITAKKRKTKSIYTEILFNLSISKNITESLKKFGVDDLTRDVVVSVIARENDDDQIKNEQLFNYIDGEEINFESLVDMVDLKDIKENYKISDIEAEKFPILNSVLTRIAVKDIL